MNKITIFKNTIPVLMGYIPLGFSFGIYGVSQGMPLWAMALSSVLVYAGSVSFVLAAFIASKASIFDTFIISFLINFRHFFYTMTLLDEIKKLKNPYYFIYALTDETFALLKSRKKIAGEDLNLLFNLTALLNHCYWISGVMLGSLFGSILKIDFSGVEFTLVALFAVLTYELFKSDKNYRVLSLGFGISLIGLFIFPNRYFLFGTLIISMAILLFFRRYFQ